MTVPPETTDVARKGSLWRTVRAVGWSFFGVRKNSGFQDDIAKLNPLHIIAVGLVAAALFVVVLIMLVRWIAAS
jgi:hypothetical protein